MSFADRVDYSDKHEKSIRLELECRLCDVRPRGMGTYPKNSRQLGGWPSILRYEPDMLACRGRDRWYVDGKDRDPHSVWPNWSINKDAFIEHLWLHTQKGMMVVYVFGDMSVATPIDVWNACIPNGTLNDIHREFLVVEPKYTRPMDDIFGRPRLWPDPF